MYDKTRQKLATDKWRAKNRERWNEISKPHSIKNYYVKSVSISFDYEVQAKIFRKCLL